MGIAFAGEPLDRVLGPSAVMPPKAERILLNPPPALPTTLTPEFFSTNPEAVVAFVEARPERLDPRRMAPELVLTLTRVLLGRDRPFLAEKLLGDAANLWPDQLTIGLSHGRVLRRLGRPHAAIRRLTVVLEKAPKSAEAHYLRAGALLEIDNRDQRRLLLAKEALQTALRLEPNYRDAETDSPEAARFQLKQIEARLGQIKK